MAYIAEKRLWLDATGKVVQDGDEAAAVLLVGEGGQLSDADANKYGLTDTKAKADTTENKARPAAPANKAKG